MHTCTHTHIHTHTHTNTHTHTHTHTHTNTHTNTHTHTHMHTHTHQLLKIEEVPVSNRRKRKTITTGLYLAYSRYIAVHHTVSYLYCCTLVMPHKQSGESLAHKVKVELMQLLQYTRQEKNTLYLQLHVFIVIALYTCAYKYSSLCRLQDKRLYLLMHTHNIQRRVDLQLLVVLRQRNILVPHPSLSLTRPHHSLHSYPLHRYSIHCT